MAQGIRTAKLPIGDYIKMASRFVLTTNQVVEIMLKYLECRDWKVAFMEVIPQRKQPKARSKNDVNMGEQDGEDEEDEEGGEVKVKTEDAEIKVKAEDLASSSLSSETVEKLEPETTVKTVVEAEIPGDSS